MRVGAPERTELPETVMRPRTIIVLLIAVSLPLQAVAAELILPVFALNAELPDGERWSTEIYLVNSRETPVQVGLAGLLPGTVVRPAPCGEFMSQTRVVPPRSAVVWTASGLASDLGCAHEVLGALKLRSDGPIHITGRLVRHPEADQAVPQGVLSGGGQPLEAMGVRRLPGPTTLLLPALLWHRNPCGAPAYSTVVGFANPGTEPVTAILYLPEERRRALLVDGRGQALPHQIVIEPGRWQQLAISPMNRTEDICLEPESFDLEIVIDGPLAVYGSVFDHWSKDSRTVTPFDLEGRR
jgi:hypothetical protein